MALTDFCNVVHQGFKLDTRLSRTLQPHVALGKHIQQVSHHAVWIVAATCDQKVMQTIDDPPAVQIVHGHQLVEGPHGAFEDTRVFFSLAFPLPIVDTASQGLFEDELNISP